MILAFRFAAEIGLCSKTDLARVSAHLAAVGLPVTLEQAGIHAEPARIAAHMRHDKKAQDGRVRLVLPRRIGEAFLHEGVAVADVAAFLERQREGERERVFRRRLAPHEGGRQDGTP
jgi:3-dehydroquinate synthase